MAEEAQAVEQEEVPPTNEAEQAEEQGDEVEKKEEATTSDDAEDAGETDGRKNKGVGKRINELTREKYDAMRRAEDARREAEYWRQQATAPRQQTPADVKPSINDYETFEEYSEALAEWKFDQKIKEREIVEYNRQQERTVAEKTTQQAKAWEERESKARQEIDDYDEVINPLLSDPKILHHPGIGEALAASEIGPRILHYLGTNLSEAMAIAQMSPPAAAKAIGRIEAKLEAQSKPKSSAPTPPKPVKPAFKAEGLRDELPVDEWLRERNRQLYGSRR